MDICCHYFLHLSHFLGCQKGIIFWLVMRRIIGLVIRHIQRQNVHGQMVSSPQQRVSNREISLNNSSALSFPRKKNVFCKQISFLTRIKDSAVGWFSLSWRERNSDVSVSTMLRLEIGGRPPSSISDFKSVMRQQKMQMYINGFTQKHRHTLTEMCRTLDSLLARSSEAARRIV